jgi:hypothetical protein
MTGIDDEFLVGLPAVAATTGATFDSPVHAADQRMYRTKRRHGVGVGTDR